MPSLNANAMRRTAAPIRQTEADPGPTLRLDTLARLSSKRLATLLLDAATRDAALLARLRIEVASAPAAPQDEMFMVGRCPALLEIFDRIRRYAATDVPVLITGESGTGKELAARALHSHSRRASGPFVALNCAALPPSLVASELFGYEKGAFTGAAGRRAGHIESAHGGTLFLDEVGDLPPETQGHLLRFLQDKQIVRLGATEPITVDVRIVSATNVPLARAIREQRFREDLYYRLHVLTMHLPPLRERGDDIDQLAAFFLKQIAAEFGLQPGGFTPEALAALRSHAWPGNIREMIAAIRQAAIIADGPMIGASELGLAARSPAAERGRDAGDARATLLAAMEITGGNMTETARRLHVSRATLYRMMRRFDVAPARVMAPRA